MTGAIRCALPALLLVGACAFDELEADDADDALVPAAEEALGLDSLTLVQCQIPLKGGPVNAGCGNTEPRPPPPPPPRGSGVAWQPPLAASGGPTYFLHDFYADADAGQCGGTGARATELGATTSAVTLDTDNRAGGCYQQFAVFDPTNRLAGLRLAVGFAQTPGADGQCDDVGERDIPVVTSLTGAWASWSRRYRIDTDNRAGGCQQTFKVAGRADIALEISVQPTAGGDPGQCPSRGTYVARWGEPVTITLDMDQRPGGCTQTFRLRTDGDSPTLPSLYGQQDLSMVRNETTSVLIGDLNRRGGGYVMPPSSGRAVLSQLSPDRNLQYCETMAQLQQSSRDLAASMAAAVLDAEPGNLELEQIREEKRRVRETIAANRDYRSIERQVRYLEDAIDEADVGEDIAELSRQLTALRTLAQQKRAAYEGAQRQLRDAEAREAAANRRLADRLAALQSAHEQLVSMYVQYASLEGGTTVLTYQSGWNDNLARLQAANPDLWFRPVTTQSARVYASLAAGIGSDSYLASSPSILRYTVNGTPISDGGAAVPVGAYPDSVRVDATMSLVAACVQAKPGLFDVEKSAAGQPLFAMTVLYEYPTAFVADVVVHYDLWKIYEVLRTSGGGLRRPNVAAVLDAPSAADRIRFEWPADPDADPEARREAEQRIAFELIQEVIAAIGEARFSGDLFARFDLPAPPRGGIVRSIAQSQPFRLSALTATTAYEPVLARARTIPRERDCLGAIGCIPRLTASVVANRSLTVGVPGERGVSMADVDLGDDGSPRALRVLTSSIRVAKSRSSYECGWFSLWCDGFTWAERVRDRAAIQRILDGARSRRFGQVATAPRLGSTLYTP